MSATALPNSREKNSGAYGNGCVKSPETRPATTHSNSNVSESLTIPAKKRPVATICAPVSVAMSTTSSASTSSPDANATPSARTSLPSASVLLISTLRPLLHSRTSSGRNAAGPTAFSATHKTQCRSPPPRLDPSGSSVTAALNAPSAAAAPPRSVFMPGMPVLPLICNPPVSKVIPLPTSAVEHAAASPWPRWHRCTSAGSRPSRAAAAPTPTMPPNPPAMSSVSRSVVATTRRDAFSFSFSSDANKSAFSSAQTFSASATSASGSMNAGGVSTMRAARRTPPATDAAAANASPSTPAPDAFPLRELASKSATFTVPLTATAPLPLSVRRASVDLAEYVGKARATAAAIATASEASANAHATPSVFPKRGALTPARHRVNACDAEGALCLDNALASGRTMTVSSNTLVPVSVPSSPSSSLKTTLVVRFAPSDPGFVSRASARTRARTASGRCASIPSSSTHAFLPTTASASHDAASASDGVNSSGEDAAHSASLAGVVTAGVAVSVARARVVAVARERATAVRPSRVLPDRPTRGMSAPAATGGRARAVDAAIAGRRVGSDGRARREEWRSSGDGRGPLFRADEVPENAPPDLEISGHVLPADRLARSISARGSRAPHVPRASVAARSSRSPRWRPSRT